MDTNFLTAIEIAQMLKISKALAYRLISRGEISSVRFGRTVRIPKAALEKFIAEKSIDSLQRKSSEKQDFSKLEIRGTI
jgi:excisionase family DNA binding protein